MRPTFRPLATVGTVLISLVLLAACGGGSTSSDSSVTASPAPGSGAITIVAGTAYENRLAPVGTGTQYRLSGAPTGMTVQPRSGYLHWTPYNDQTGTYTVTLSRVAVSIHQTSTLTFVVTQSSAVTPPGIYVSPNGSDANPGTSGAPFKTLAAATAVATPGTTIYLRGGDYYNDGYGTPYSSRSSGALDQIKSSGTATAWIRIRPQGNEYPRLISDVNGLSFLNAQYWEVDNLELEGNGQSLDMKTALGLWWNTGPERGQIDGRGIAMNGSNDITVSQCVIHDFPGAGLSNNGGTHQTGGAYITLEDSIVYNNAWWSPAGTHGFANPSAVTSDNTDTSSFKIQMLRNVVFGNQSSMISNKFPTPYVNMDIDEGDGLQMQNTQGTFVGRFLVQDNLLLLNGKAGMGLNFVDHGVIERNAFYENSQAENFGELTVQTSNSDSIAYNLFQALPTKRTIGLTNTYPGVGTNYATPSADSAALPSQIVQVPSVFMNPAADDFTAATGIPSGFGVDPSALAAEMARLAEYGLTPAASPTLVNDTYVTNLKTQIFATWPNPASNPSIPANLILHDPANGYCYTYADRNDWPGPPHSGTPCP